MNEMNEIKRNLLKNLINKRSFEKNMKKEETEKKIQENDNAINELMRQKQLYSTFLISAKYFTKPNAIKNNDMQRIKEVDTDIQNLETAIANLEKRILEMKISNNN